MNRSLLLLFSIVSSIATAQNEPDILAFQHLSSDAIPNHTVDLTDGEVFNRGTFEPQPSIFMPFLGNSTLVALSSGTVGSISFELTGPLSISALDNTAPFAIFENTGDTFETRRFPEGIYTLTATPYSDKDAEGTAGESFAISFTILDYDWVVYSGSVIDAEADESLFQYTYQSQLWETEVDWSKEINFEATPFQGTPEYVSFELKGPSETLEVRDYSAPFTLFGDDGAMDYYGKVLEPGSYELSAIPYDSTNPFRPSNLFFRLFFTVPEQEPTVGSLVGIQEITNDNGTLYYHDIDNGTFRRNDPEKQDPAETPFLATSNFVAQTDGGNIGSVRFAFTNNIHAIDYFPTPQYFVDNEAPFTLWEDENNNFLFEQIAQGHIEVTATPFSGPNAEGEQGVPMSVSLDLWDAYSEFTDTLFIRDAANGNVLLEIFAGQENTFPLDTILNKNIVFEVFEKAGGILPFAYGIQGNNTHLGGDVYSKTDDAYLFPDEPVSLDAGSYRLSTSYLNIDFIYQVGIPMEWEFSFTEGAEARTYVPDDNFEQALIDLGYDDVLDDYVVTANIAGLTTLDVSNRRIESMEGVQDFTGLQELDCSRNALSQLDVLGLVQLTSLNCFANRIVSLDIHTLSNLKELICSANGITELDLSNNSLLEVLEVGLTSLSEIDLTQNTELKVFLAQENFVKTYDFRQNTALEELRIGSTLLEGIDLTQNTQLKILSVSGEKITSLDISNLQNLQSFWSSRSPNLRCIQVWDVDYALAQENWFKDETTSYSENCNATSDDSDGDEVLNEVDLCPDTPSGETVNNFGCSVSQLADLAVQNIGLSIGSDPCSENPSGFAEISVLKNVPLEVQIFKDGAEFYTGSIELTAPLRLNQLAFGAYQICVSNETVLGYEQCFDVSYSVLSNSASTKFIIQNPGQTYTMQVAGSTSYTVVINGVGSDYVFDSTAVQEIEIPLTVGANVISIIGNLDCSSQEDLTYVPDDNFEQALIDLGYDDVLDDHVRTSNIDTLTSLDVSLRNIEDISGIEDFLALEYLNVFQNNLSSIDVTSLTNLTTLNTGGNHSISTIDVTNNIHLEYLYVGDSSIKEIDLSKNVKLVEFEAFFTALIEIDLSQNTALKELTIAADIAEIDVSNNTLLEVLNLSFNRLNTIDISKNTALKTLILQFNYLVALDLRQHQELVNLDISSNPNLTCVQVSNVEDALSKDNWVKNDWTSYALDCSLPGTGTRIFVPDDNFEQRLIDLGYDDILDDYATIDNIETIRSLDLKSYGISDLTGLEAFVELEKLDISYNNLQSIDLSYLTELKEVSLVQTNISELDISQNKQLYALSAGDNNISSINLSGLTELALVSFPKNEISTIDVSHNTKLEVLILDRNKIEEIDLTTNGQLREIDLSNNYLRGINVTDKPYLQSLSIANNSLETLDVSYNSELKRLYTANNQLSFINLQNGNNAQVDFIRVEGNAIDLCIQIDDLAIPDMDSFTWQKDDTATYSLDCSVQDTAALVDDEPSFRSKITAYPTLTKGKITIDNSNNEEIGTISIASLNGKKINVLAIHDSPAKIDLDISGHTKGIYVIRIAKMNGNYEVIKVMLD